MCGGCDSGNCGRLWCVGTGGAGVVPPKPCCERCERKFRNQRKPKNRYISALFVCWAKASCKTCETSETVLISMLQKELDRKNEQLAVKDKQIEELNARLTEISWHWLPPSRPHRLPRHFTQEQYNSSLPPVLIRAREVETIRKNRDGLVGCFVVR